MNSPRQRLLRKRPRANPPVSPSNCSLLPLCTSPRSTVSAAAPIPINIDTPVAASAASLRQMSPLNIEPRATTSDNSKTVINDRNRAPPAGGTKRVRTVVAQVPSAEVGRKSISVGGGTFLRLNERSNPSNSDTPCVISLNRCITRFGRLASEVDVHLLSKAYPFGISRCHAIITHDCRAPPPESHKAGAPQLDSKEPYKSTLSLEPLLVTAGDSTRALNNCAGRPTSLGCITEEPLQVRPLIIPHDPFIKQSTSDYTRPPPKTSAPPGSQRMDIAVRCSTHLDTNPLRLDLGSLPRGSGSGSLFTSRVQPQLPSETSTDNCNKSSPLTVCPTQAPSTLQEAIDSPATPPPMADLPFEMSRSPHSVLKLPSSISAADESSDLRKILETPHRKESIGRYLIAACGGGWYLRDGVGSRRSLNGTRLNLFDDVGTSPDSGVWLREGDLIEFGPNLKTPEFRYEVVACLGTRNCPKTLQQPKNSSAQPLNVMAAEPIKDASVATATNEQPASDHHEAKSAVVDFQEELLCSICRDLMVNPSALTCGHVFCQRCIDLWLQQLKFACPSCRSRVEHPPTRLPMVNSIIAGLVAGASNETKDDYAARLKVTEDAQRDYKKHLRDLEIKLQQNTKAMLNITKTWSPAERAWFRDLMRHARGSIREFHCGLVGLTAEWLQKSSQRKLKAALINLNIKIREGMSASTTSTGDPSECSDQDIRWRLLMFIHFG